MFLNIELCLGGSISLAVIFIVLWTKKWDVTNWRHIRPNTTQSEELSKSPFLPSSFSSLSLQHYKYPLCCVIRGTITTITFYNVQPPARRSVSIRCRSWDRIENISSTFSHFCWQLVCVFSFSLLWRSVFTCHSLKILRDIREKIIANFLGTVTWQLTLENWEIEAEEDHWVVVRKWREMKSIRCRNEENRPAADSLNTRNLSANGSMWRRYRNMPWRELTRLGLTGETKSPDVDFHFRFVCSGVAGVDFL